jgi:hypothetical protein
MEKHARGRHLGRPLEAGRPHFLGRASRCAGGRALCERKKLWGEKAIGHVPKCALFTPAVVFLSVATTAPTRRA